MKREIYDYIGVNDAIVQNKEKPEEADAFYSGELVPFFMQLGQGLTAAIFTEREQGHGNEILCEMDRIQFETLDKRVSAAKYLTDLGALSLDQVLDIFGFPPIGGEEGARRVQTLNMVNAQIVDQYQLASAGEKTDPTKKEDPPPEEGTKKTPEPEGGPEAQKEEN